MGRGYRDKSLEENLAPLVRFLERRVGKPWSKVRAEMTQHLRVTSAVQKHVMDHVKEYVSEVAWAEDDGTMYTLYWGRPMVVAPMTRRRFFVHPVTGLLTMFPRVARKRRGDPIPPNPNVRDVSATTQYRRIDGAWFEVTLAPLPVSPRNPYRGLPVRDVVSGRIVRLYGQSPADVDPMGPVWRSRRYAVAKRQMSKREIRGVIT
jgi:hypothetical protein